MTREKRSRPTLKGELYAKLDDQPHAGCALLTAREAAQRIGLSVPAFWKGVRDRRLPIPVYPMPRAPRWFEHELLAALEQTRTSPTEAMARRRSGWTSRNAAIDAPRRP
jgi:predicted DNA-binding transcriptional regulator AlpA